MLLALAAGLLSTVCACAVPVAQAPVRIVFHIPATRFTLANGLEVVVQEDHSTPRVAINLRYHAGYKDDPPLRSGMAHLVEHLQFTEVGNMPRDGLIQRMIELGGADINGATDEDGTSYYETVPVSSLESALWIEAQRMASARLGWPDDVIAREKNVVAQEIKLRYRNEPNGFQHQLLSRAVFPEGHPYRHSLEEEKEERDSTPSELRDFAERFYGPNDATLLLVGDVTVARAKELATRYFGAESPCQGPPASRSVAPLERAAYKRVRVAADRKDTIVYVAWPLPASGEDGFYAAAFALEDLEGHASWFAVDEKKTMQPRSFGWGFVGGRLGSFGYIYARPEKGSSADDLADAILVMGRRIVAYDWVDRGTHRTSAIARVLRRAENLGSRADLTQSYRDQFGDPDHVLADLRDVQAVTRQRVVAAVDQFLDPDRAVIIQIVPDSNAPPSGRVVEEVRR